MGVEYGQPVLESLGADARATTEVLRSGALIGCAYDVVAGPLPSFSCRIEREGLS
jgi:hypothetical protein